jgi:hypothetical protein
MPHSPTARRPRLRRGSASCCSSATAAREVPPDALERYAHPSDEHLLWVDAIAADGPPDALAVLGVALDAREPDSGGDVGLPMRGAWRHLFVRSLDWQSTRRWPSR